VSKEDLVRKMVAEVDEWGGVDVIFNNAGIMLGDVCSSMDLNWD
jgi:NADP-dependent 3-hydroxy acid dehydrogenase YdfG